jgi:hypothetical protein
LPHDNDDDDDDDDADADAAELEGAAVTGTGAWLRSPAYGVFTLLLYSNADDCGAGPSRWPSTLLLADDMFRNCADFRRASSEIVTGLPLAFCSKPVDRTPAVAVVTPPPLPHDNDDDDDDDDADADAAELEGAAVTGTGAWLRSPAYGVFT